MKNEPKEQEFQYFQFPLFLVKDLLINPEIGYNRIIAYGIVNFANKLPYEISEVSRQLVYDFYRNQKSIQPRLLRKLNALVRENVFTNDVDYNGFDLDGNFVAEENLPELETIFKKDNALFKDAILHYRIDIAAKMLGVSIDNVELTLKEFAVISEELMEIETLFEKQPYAGIKKDQLFDFFKKNDPFETELLCAYIGVRSIITKKPFWYTNKKVIAMRMIGAKSNKALQVMLRQEKLAKIYAKYRTRYWADKIIDTLVERGFIRKIPVGRKIFFSLILSMEQLETAINVNRKKNNIRQIERAARLRILEATKKLN